MALTLALVFLALRAGLRMRRARQRGDAKPPGLRARHVVLARPAVLLAGFGLLSGPISAVFIRDWAPLQTLHGWLALSAGVLLLAAGALGQRLKAGTSRSVEIHARLGLLGALAAALAAFAGFVLLP